MDAHGDGEMAAELVELVAKQPIFCVSARLGNASWRVKAPSGLAAKSGTHGPRTGYPRLNGMTGFDWASRCYMAEQGQLRHEIRLPSRLHFPLFNLF